MKITFSILVFVLGTFGTMAQISGASQKFALPGSLNESSGAIFFNNRLITHNDSGGEAKLYELDTISGIIEREVTILNATNVDWEDITQDETSIYIGDIGNNVSGNRTDLKIYKISKTDYLSMDTVTAETISFRYSDQTDFTAKSVNNTEWDAEALVSYDASNLIVFTKNWVDGITKGYLVSKNPGIYSLTALATTLNSNGLITGGTYNPLTGKLYLVGYTPPLLPSPLQPFVWKSEGFIGADIFSGTNTQTSLSASFSFEQTEAITYVDENRYFITSESFNVSILSDYAKLISFSTNDATLSAQTVVNENDTLLYPNPVDSFLYIKNEAIDFIEIYDIKSVQVYKGDDNMLDMSTFSKGVYVVKINFKDQTSQLKKLIKN